MNKQELRSAILSETDRIEIRTYKELKDDTGVQSVIDSIETTSKLGKVIEKPIYSGKAKDWKLVGQTEHVYDEKGIELLSALDAVEV